MNQTKKMKLHHLVCSSACLQFLPRVGSFISPAAVPVDEPKPTFGYNINWDDIDESTNPFALGSAFGRSKLTASPPALDKPITKLAKSPVKPAEPMKKNNAPATKKVKSILGTRDFLPPIQRSLYK